MLWKGVPCSSRVYVTPRNKLLISAAVGNKLLRLHACASWQAGKVYRGATVVSGAAQGQLAKVVLTGTPGFARVKHAWLLRSFPRDDG